MKFRKALELGILNFISYFIAVFDIRACAQANYLAIAIINLVLSLFAFTLFKRLQEANSWHDRIAYTIFGTAGAVFSAWVSKIVFGQ